MPIINSSSIAETKSITENGLYDVARYTSADVNVEGTQPVYTRLNLSPSRSSGSFYPEDFEADGFSEVSLNAVTSDIDSNIQAGNIKNGVTILGVTGNYSGATPTLITKNITQNGTYNASSDSADGYSQVTVNVSGGGGGGLSRNYIVNEHGTLVPDPESSFMGLGGATDVGDYIFCNAYENNQSITGALDFSSLERVNGAYAFYRSFYNCENITVVDFSSLENIHGYYSFTETFALCSGLSGSLDLSSVKKIGNDSCPNMFYSCANITSVDLSSLQFIDTNSCAHIFADCYSLTTIDFSNLYYIGSDGLNGAFSADSELSSANFDSLIYIGELGMSACFAYSGLQTISFPKLSIIKENAFDQCFTGGNLQHIYFPALANYSIRNTNIFGDSFLGTEEDGRINGCTIHLPSNFNPSIPNPSFDVTVLGGYPNFGGTNTILAFDQPSTADGVLYCDINDFYQDYQYSNRFSYITGLVDVHFSSMTVAPTELKSVFNSMFNGCSDLRSISFDVLTEENLSSNSFVFSNLVAGCSNVTVHFPSNLQYIMNNWSDVLRGFGGANTTVLWDLPSTE